MDSKIQELTDKIFKDGVVKGEEKAQQLLAEAQAKGDKIIADAKTAADGIVADAHKKAEELRRNTEAEMKLSGEQALAAIRQKISDAITTTVVDKSVGASLSNPETIKDLVKTMLTSWKPEGGVEVVLPADKQGLLEQAFKADASAVLKAGMSISFSKQIKGGFQIVTKGNGCKVSLSDEDFAEFFKAFLRPRTRAFLFGA